MQRQVIVAGGIAVIDPVESFGRPAIALAPLWSQAATTEGNLIRPDYLLPAEQQQLMFFLAHDDVIDCELRRGSRGQQEEQQK